MTWESGDNSPNPEPETETEAPTRRRRPVSGWRLHWLAVAIIGGACLVAGMFVWALVGKTTETDRADTAVAQGQGAQADAKTLATGVQAACRKPVVDPTIKPYCPKAAEVISEPPIRVEAGRDGIDGRDGRDGTDGKPGRDGKPGVNGTPGRDGSPGADGIDGRDGRDGTDGSPGRPGADGTPGADGSPGADGADGADGQDGADGADGRGVSTITCDSNSMRSMTFVFTFTDGTKQEVTCGGISAPPSSLTPTASR